MVRRPGLSTVPSRLVAGDQSGRFRYGGTQARAEGYTVHTSAGGTRVYSKSQMLDWLNGFDEAFEAGEPKDTEKIDLSPLSEVRSVLVYPSLTDQCRVLVRVGMQRSGVGVVEMARRIGVTKKSVSEALHFGGSGHFAMMAALGLDPHVRPGLANTPRTEPTSPAPAGDWAEPAPLLRMRILTAAHEHGILRWIAPANSAGVLDVNKGMHTRLFTVQIGDRTTEIHTDFVAAWVVGVADVIAPTVADAFYRASLNPMIDAANIDDA